MRFLVLWLCLGLVLPVGAQEPPPFQLRTGGVYLGTATVTVTVGEDGSISVAVRHDLPITILPCDPSDPVPGPDPAPDEFAALRRKIQQATDAVSSPRKAGEAAAIRTIYDGVGSLPITESRQLQTATDAMYRLIPGLDSWRTWKETVDEALKPYLSRPLEDAKRAWRVVNDVLAVASLVTLHRAGMEAIR